jgi:molybdopterin-binding protein
MKISARNTLAGTVKRIEHGAVNIEVTLTLGDGTEIVSIITRHSADRLKLTAGAKAYAVIKASDVMVGVDD